MNNCYVYVLLDPITQEIFYVGKGTGSRDSSHLKPSLWNNPKNTVNPFLYFKIKSLMENKTPPIIKRLHENISEDVAYNIENNYIKQYGRRFLDNNGKLFNISDFKGGSAVGKKKPWSDDRKEKHKCYWRERRKYNPSYDELYNDYIVNNLKRKEISEKYNISDVLVKKRLNEFGIIKPKKLAYPQRNEYTCIVCSKKFETPLSVKVRKYCSNKCYRNNNAIDVVEKSQDDVKN